MYCGGKIVEGRPAGRLQDAAAALVSEYGQPASGAEAVARDQRAQRGASVECSRSQCQQPKPKQYHSTQWSLRVQPSSVESSRVAYSRTSLASRRSSASVVRRSEQWKQAKGVSEGGSCITVIDYIVTKPPRRPYAPTLVTNERVMVGLRASRGYANLSGEGGASAQLNDNAKEKLFPSNSPQN